MTPEQQVHTVRALIGMVIQNTTGWTEEELADYGITPPIRSCVSVHLGFHADALRVLADLGLMEIDDRGGRCVLGDFIRPAHILKTWPEPFQAVIDGRKCYEVRKDDRSFAVGDYLRLDEWEPHFAGRLGLPHWQWTGRKQWVRVTYKTPGGSFGLPADVCVLRVEKCDAPEGRDA